VTTNIGIGFSKSLNSEKAAREAASMAKAQTGEERIDIAIILSSIHYDPKKTIPVIRNILDAHRTIGCSTAGIILSTSIESQGLAILAVSSQEIEFGIGSIKTRAFPSAEDAGIFFAQNCISDYGHPKRQGFLFFVDNRISNTSAFLKGIQEIFGKAFPIIGAASCDDFHFTNNFQIFENQALQHSAIGMIIGGHAHLGIGSNHGWRPLGKPRTADKTNGNIIETIDGEKASYLYEEYFKRETSSIGPTKLNTMSALYPLGIFIKEANDFLLRNVIDILPNGCLVCQGSVPSGSTLHIMISNRSLCMEAAVNAAKQAAEKLKDQEPKIIFIIESMARLKLLGRTAFQEIKKIKDVFPPNVPIIGMYSNNEAYPFQGNNMIVQSHVQNESIIVLAIS